MTVFRKYVFTSLMALSSAFAVAQTSYEKIEVGSVLQTGIALGAFTKPIPLPDGEWLVVNKRVDELTLTGGSRSSAPRVTLTLKNNQASTNVLFAIVMTFTPDSIPINWGNNKCESKNPKVIADDFGYNPNSMLYVCAIADAHDKFKNTVATTPENPNKWFKDNLTALSAYPDDIADNALFVDVRGNRFRGKSINFTFILKREGDLVTDPAYTQFIKDWTHAAGLSLAKVLDNSTTTFALPPAYVVK